MSDSSDSRQLLTRSVAVPEHVVSRAFDRETVVLNIRTGAYHGLNPVAARMVEALREVPTPAAAVAPLAAEFGQPEEVIERDLAKLVEGLAERGLVELGPDAGG